MWLSLRRTNDDVFFFLRAYFRARRVAGRSPGTLKQKCCPKKCFYPETPHAFQLRDGPAQHVHTLPLCTSPPRHQNPSSTGLAAIPLLSFSATTDGLHLCLSTPSLPRGLRNLASEQRCSFPRATTGNSDPVDSRPHVSTPSLTLFSPRMKVFTFILIA